MNALVFVRFHVKPGSEARVEAILQDMVVKTRLEPGCRRYDLYQATAASGGRMYCLLEKYADEAAVLAHRETTHYKDYRANIVDLLAEPIEVTLLEALNARGG